MRRLPLHDYIVKAPRFHKDWLKGQIGSHERAFPVERCLYGPNHGVTRSPWCRGECYNVHVVSNAGESQACYYNDTAAVCSCGAFHDRYHNDLVESQPFELELTPGLLARDY